MQIEKGAAKKAKTHTVYKDCAGKRVPGVTTVCGILNKPALVPWANRLGLEGIKVREYVDELAVIGTLGHYLIECHILSQILGNEVVPGLDDYTKNQYEMAKNCLDKYLGWEKDNNPEYLGSEMALVSDVKKYGGCIDIYASINGKKTLIDIKTCKAIYKDHFLQVAGGYAPLLHENGHKVDDVRILRVGRSADEGFEDVRIPNVKLYKEKFLLCLQIYNLDKKL